MTDEAGSGGAPQLRSLPERVRPLLAELQAPLRLSAHLALVHDAAVELVELLDDRWPGVLRFDREAVLLGAAVHDVGKVRATDELLEEGSEHEAIGERLLLERGWPAAVARLARTHGAAAAEPEATFEDRLVALADALWKGGRLSDVEAGLVDAIAEVSGEERWEVYGALDEILEEVAEDAPERLGWYRKLVEGAARGR